MTEDVLSIKQKYTHWILSRENVVSVGVGIGFTAERARKELCIIVGVSKKVPCTQLLPSQQIPRYLEGIRTDVQEVGVIRALQCRADRWRPAPGGVSIGHAHVTAGTLGCLVQRDGTPLILSNNHVLANSNRARPGDPILQPGAYDGGNPRDPIATLEDFIPIRFELTPSDCPVTRLLAKWISRVSALCGSKVRYRAVQESSPNIVDCAVARPLSEDLVSNHILEVGFPLGVTEGEPGTFVKKSGRTTGLTEGVVTQAHVTVKVLYGPALAIFEDQLAGPLPSQGGDSGSVVLTRQNEVVGLLFAGSEQVSVMNRIQSVMQLLRVSL